jgi:LysM repeat protein
MKKDLLTLALLALIAFIVATIVFVIGEIGRQDEEGTPVAEIPTTGLPAPSPRGSDALTPTLESQPAATRTLTPESTATPTPCVPPAAWDLYTVQPGDTLYSIAAWYGMTAEEIQLANCLSSADEILVGQSLYVPWLVTPSPTPCFPPADWALYTVQSGENLFRIAARYGMTAKQMQQANCLASEALIAGQSIYVPYIISTPIPSPIIINTPVIPEGLPEEISFDPGGEPTSARCPGPSGVGPHITLSNRVTDFLQLCIYGFATGEMITVKLSPQRNQDFVVSQEREVGSEAVVKIYLWAPVGLDADWIVSILSEGESFEDVINFDPFPSDTRATNTMPADEINPFVFQWCDYFDPPKSYFYQLDEKMVVKGTNFTPNREVSVGLYWESEDGSFPFVRGQIAKTNDLGDFTTVFTILESDPSGRLWVISTTDKTIKTYRRVDQDVQCAMIP